MTRRCLLNVFAPQNLLPAIAAVRWYGIHAHAREEAEVTTLLHMPGWEADKLSQTAPLIEKLCASQNWSKPLVLPSSGMDQILRKTSNLSDPAVLARFRQATGGENGDFDEVYYSHDVVGSAAQLSMRAYPTATHITYGESMGLMEDKQYLLACLLGQGWDESNRPPKTADPQATKAVLIMPADQTGDCLEGKELLVVPRLLALAVISDFQKTLPELEEYSRSVLARGKGPHFLFILANYADVGCLSPSSEAQMYEEMIRGNAPKGCTVLLKAHPLAGAPVHEILAARLVDCYSVEVISPQFSRYPMEIWQYLLSKCNVISLSYCSISLEYLYNQPVIYPLNGEIIRKYMEERSWMRILDGDEFFRRQRECLKSWDGRGVLYTGRRVSHPPTRSKDPAPQIHPEGSEDQQQAELKNQEGVSLFQQGKHEQALLALMEARRLSPLHPAINRNLGVVYWNTQKPAEALPYFSLAHLLAPDDRALFFELHQLLICLNQSDAAKELYLTFAARHPGDPDLAKLEQAHRM